MFYIQLHGRLWSVISKFNSNVGSVFVLTFKLLSFVIVLYFEYSDAINETATIKQQIDTVQLMKC